MHISNVQYALPEATEIPIPTFNRENREQL